MSAVCIGRILKPHKTGGQFLCRLFDDLAPDERGIHRLSRLKELDICPPQKKAPSNSLAAPALGLATGLATDGMRLFVEHLQPVRQNRDGETAHILLKCRNWHAPEPIRAFCNWELWAAAEYASPCCEDEFRYCELAGAELYTESSEGRRVVAWVCGLLEGGAQLLLELKANPRYYSGGGAAPFYIPFHSSVIGKIERRAAESLCGQLERPGALSRLSMELLDLEYFEDLRPDGLGM